MVPSPERGLYLLNLYFGDTGLMYPFVSVPDVLEAYDAFTKTQFSRVSRSWLSLFNAIFAFATYISAAPASSTSKNIEQADVFFNRSLALVTGSALRFPDIPSGV